MSTQPDQSQRTEQATPKRLEDARKKGDAPKSQELTATILLAATALALWLLAAPVAGGIARLGVSFIDHPHTFLVDPQNIRVLFTTISLSLGITLSGLAILFLVMAVLANIIQARPVFTTHRMQPSWQKISPLAGLKRIFGASGLVNFAKGLGKLIIVGMIMVISLWPERQLLINLLYTEDYSVMTIAQMMVLRLILMTILAMSIIAALDFAWQRYSWQQRLRMTREELRREQKETEGDPQIKARQRQRREVQARRRMAAAVKEATVVIMNPTHYAVALKYETGEQGAPICVAKGRDELALRMRSIAREHQVPVIENPPLARALHANAALDEEIPLEHYEAVAKVIGFVMARAGQA